MTAIYMQDKRYSDIIQFINNLNFEPLKKLKKLKAAKWPLAIHSLEINSNERYGFKSSPPETTVTVISYVTDATCIEVNFQSFAGKNTISYNHIQTAAKFCPDLYITTFPKEGYLNMDIKVTAEKTLHLKRLKIASVSHLESVFDFLPVGW